MNVDQIVNSIKNGATEPLQVNTTTRGLSFMLWAFSCFVGGMVAHFANFVTEGELAAKIESAYMQIGKVDQKVVQLDDQLDRIDGKLDRLLGVPAASQPSSQPAKKAD